MELLVVAIIMVLFAFLRSRLSVDQPGKLQHLFEIIYGFVRGQAHDAIEHGGDQTRPVLRNALHLYSVHEPDRDHSRL